MKKKHIRKSFKLAMKRWHEILSSLMSKPFTLSEVSLSKEDEKILIKVIQQKVAFAEKKWFQIEKEVSRNPFSAGSMKLSLKKDFLKKFLENIRKDIDTLLSEFHNNSFLKSCNASLKRLLDVSENLRASYVYPSYSESFYIFDTLRLTERQD